MTNVDGSNEQIDCGRTCGNCILSGLIGTCLNPSSSLCEGSDSETSQVCGHKSLWGQKLYLHAVAVQVNPQLLIVMDCRLPSSSLGLVHVSIGTSPDLLSIKLEKFIHSIPLLSQSLKKIYIHTYLSHS